MQLNEFQNLTLTRLYRHIHVGIYAFNKNFHTLQKLTKPIFQGNS